MEKADDQLKTVRGRKIIYIDASEVIGRPTLRIPKLISLNTIMYSKLEAFVRSWLENHTIDAVVMTEPRLYLTLSEFLMLYRVYMSPYIAPGWTILTLSQCLKLLPKF